MSLVWLGPALLASRSINCDTYKSNFCTDVSLTSPRPPLLQLPELLQLPLVSDMVAAFIAATLLWFKCVAGGSNYNLNRVKLLFFINCVRRMSSDRVQLIDVIVHLGIPGVCDLDRLLDFTSVSLGIPSDLEMTSSSSLSFNFFIIFISTNHPNYHESVDRMSVEFCCFGPSLWSTNQFLVIFFKV